MFVAFRDRANALFLNDDGVFREVAAELGLADPRRTVGAVWFDADDDGDLDLYAANMDGDANGFFRNDEGHFNDVAEALGIAWGGRAPDDPENGTVRPCAADVDNDGRLDLFTANYGPNGLFLNRGARFDDVSAERGVAIDSRYDTCAFADYDDDGLLDYYVNGTVTGGTSYPDHLYHNAGDRFVETTPPELAAIDGDHGAQWADFDGDGDLDLALAASNADSPHPLLRNVGAHAAGSASLLVMALDSAGRPVLAGSIVRVLEAGTDHIIATRLIDSGSGYNSQNILPVHFGLASPAPVDLEVDPAARRPSRRRENPGRRSRRTRRTYPHPSYRLVRRRRDRALRPWGGQPQASKAGTRCSADDARFSLSTCRTSSGRSSFNRSSYMSMSSRSSASAAAQAFGIAGYVGTLSRVQVLVGTARSRAVNRSASAFE